MTRLMLQAYSFLPDFHGQNTVRGARFLLGFSMYLVTDFGSKRTRYTWFWRLPYFLPFETGRDFFMTCFLHISDHKKKTRDHGDPKVDRSPWRVHPV